VDPLTGEVKVDSDLSEGERLLDFLVIASVFKDAAVYQSHIRFHIHNSIERIWITPARLTVEPLWPNMRFTVLAKFDDGAYGDITNWSPMTWGDLSIRNYVYFEGVQAPILWWSAPGSNGLDIHPMTGFFLCTNSGLKDAMVQIRAPDSLPEPAAAYVDAGRDSRSIAQGALQLVEGPGVSQMRAVANVLILPDGFQEHEMAAFEKLTRQLVHRLRIRRRTRPFDLFKDKVNYFRAWVPSPEAGVSILEMTETVPGEGQPAAREIVTVIRSDDVPTEWHAGNPRTPPSPPRQLLNERNTAFHIAVGGRPRAKSIAGISIGQPRLNGYRYNEAILEKFLSSLSSPEDTHTPIGDVWTRGGKDQGLVVFICRSSGTLGVNYHGSYIAVSLCDNKETHAIEDGGGGEEKKIVPCDLPEKINMQLWLTAAHELSHSFSIGDEYGSDFPGRPANLPPRVFPDTDACKIGDIRKRANVQARVDLLTGNRLDADKIKWRWPRIEKAGVLAQSPAPKTGGYEILLEQGHGGAFKDGDIVRLRKRPLPTFSDHSYRLKIVGVSNDRITIAPVEAVPDNSPGLENTFPAGSILMAPRRAPDPDRPHDVLGDDLELVHRSTLDQISNSRNALNAHWLSGQDRPCREVLPVASPTPALNFEDGRPPKPPRHSAMIVGLYENGDAYDCGIYRPTGMCFMRTTRPPEDEAGNVMVSGEARGYHQFCPVCRYALVDQLDPTQHGRIDRDYARRYPK
jgi:hypothetical protein